MSTIDTLYVVWQDPHTGRYFLVGRLRAIGTSEEEVYEFAYTKGVLAARSSGFEPFLAFPDVGKEYFSTRLFPFFANRLLPLSREDYPESIERLGLSPDTASPIEVLARSGGRRATDSIELFAPPHSQESSDEQVRVLEYFFLVHGIRHMKDCARLMIGKNLHTGDSLFIVHDLQNRVDPKALVLRTSDYCCIGFIPRFLIGDVWALLENEEQVTVTLEQLNPPPAPIQQRILCRLSAIVRNHFFPCSGEDFQPLVNESKAL
jgi:hypothetical protein